jgi:hypothetical protein
VQVSSDRCLRRHPYRMNDLVALTPGDVGDGKASPSSGRGDDAAARPAESTTVFGPEEA